MIRLLTRALLTAGMTAALLVAATAHAGVRKLQPAHPVVNINTASETELMYLPHVGAVTAARIRAYITDRSTNGAVWTFTSVEQLRNVTSVKGRHLISARSLDDMRAYIVLTGQTTATEKIQKGR